MIQARIISIAALLLLCDIHGHAKDLNLKEGMECDAANGMQPICSFRRPEDIVLIPESHLLIVSETGGADRKHGNRDLVLFDTKSNEQYVLYPDKLSNTTTINHGVWGDEHCEEPDWFAPHGIDIARRPDGELALFVVNHGEKESIQMFSVVLRNDGVKLEWRGCVAFGVGNSLNDVAVLPDGGFVTGATIFANESKGNRLGSIAHGVIFLWKPGSGLSKLATLDGAYLNGITASLDGSSVFANSYREASYVVKFSVKTGEIEGVAKTKFYADNNSWSENGDLLVATIGPREGLDYFQCDKTEPFYCTFPFEVIAIDPDTMASMVIFSHPAGPPFGTATVAVQVGDELYLGSSVGNRIIKIEMP